MRFWLFILGSFAWLGACKTQPVAQPPAEIVTRDGRVTMRARVILPAQMRGLSGLACDDTGRFWSTPERGRRLLPLTLVGDSFERAGEPLIIEGLPEGWDTEALAWIAPGVFVFGTETQAAGRPRDHLLIARVEGGTVRVTETVAMSYAPWGIEARVNRGIEGLCHVGGVLVAGNENVIEEAGARWAPLGRYDLGTRSWESFRLRLVSEEGKVSAVACRPSADVGRIDALAIERHYGTSRLVRFSVPRAGPGGDIEATQVADLGKLVAGVPNMEGLAWQADGTVVIFVDNDTGGITGPCEAILLRLED